MPDRLIAPLAGAGLLAAGIGWHAGRTTALASDSARAPRSGIECVVAPSERRVDVRAAGEPFTSYVWPDALAKPVLHPIRTAAGVVVTRGFPPEPGERADHPHHVGLWFNYGDVAGFDFWNNSKAIAAERAPKMGTVVHRRIVRARGGREQAELTVEADWVSGGGETLLRERTTFRFRSSPQARTIDRFTELRPVGRAVAFKDNKEGLLGLRVRRALEDAAEAGGEFVDAAGGVTKREQADPAGVSGEYVSSEGRIGKQVWGTRGRWAMLRGDVEGRPVTVAIFDHPDNPGFPTYWHARGYGLFAANPLGQAAFSDGRERLDFSIPSGGLQRFRYRVLLLDVKATPELAERHYRAWERER